MELIDSFRTGKKLLEKYVVSIVGRCIETFKALPNVDYCNIPEGVTLTVVGDTHGQLYDVLHIFDSLGLPSPTNWFLFNGDMVDR